MLEKSPYPLLTLKLLGSLCPCLEKEEDAPARRAAWALSSTPIRWHRRLRGASSGSGAAAATATAVGGFISGMFGGSPPAGGGGGDAYRPVEGASTLTLVDAGPAGPQLVASPPGTAGGIRSKRIPLRLVRRVRARGAGGIISAGSPGGIELYDATGRELLRFDVLRPAPCASAGDEEDDWEKAGASREEDAEDAGESARDDVIDRLELLAEWERRRQAYLVTLGDDGADGNEDEVYVDEYDDDANGTSGTPGKKKGGVIAEKAQKMKHFAKREIELQKLKKERENRKAKYVKEAGGLKYTAIAMANRA